MKDNQKKGREPFDPERTPEPPQDKDPRQRMDTSGDNSPTKTKNKKRQKSLGNEKEKPKLLGESETEIDDETTI
jgi:hypothetical protein